MTSSEVLVNECGNWVDGDRFWNREKELKLLLDLIRRGANVSIIAQRRIGKTSLMRKAGRHLQKDYTVFHVDLQDARTPDDMVVKIAAATKPHASLWGKTKDVFANVLQATRDNIEAISVTELEIQLRAGMSGGVWQEKGKKIMSSMVEVDQPVVIFFDELPILIDRILKSCDGLDGKSLAQDLLTWLRAQALEHQGRLSMVFAGSIGLEPVLNKAGLSANINHLSPFKLEPWSDSAAKGCLKALAAYRDIELPEETIQRMLELLGCNIPHHVQLFFAQLWEHCLYNDKSTCSSQDVEDIFNQRMLGTKGHTELAHMEERLEKVLGNEKLPLAIDMLTQAAVAGFIDTPQMLKLCERYKVSELERTKILARLFEIFEHDGYLKKKSTGEYVFVSNLLRKWWRRRFESFFQVV